MDDLWVCLCQGGDDSEGWTERTHALQVEGVGCFVRVTRRELAAEGQWTVSQSVAWAPGVCLDPVDGVLLKP